MFRPKPYSINVYPDVVAIQGQPGSFSHGACAAIFNDARLMCFDDFEGASSAVADCKVEVAVIPIFNTIAGPVPYVPGLIYKKDLSIVGEYFLPIEMCLMGLPDADFQKIQRVHSHVHALPQCSKFLAKNGFEQVVNPDTAGAARHVAELGDPTQASISPARAAHEYGLKIFARGIQNDKNTITRFLVLRNKQTRLPKQKADQKFITAVIFKPKRNEDWALADILAILRKNRVHHSQPWSYLGQNFRTDGILIELYGHVSERRIQKALEELRIKKSGDGVTTEQRVIGVFPAHHSARFGRRYPEHKIAG